MPSKKTAVNCSAKSPCSRCIADQAFLRSRQKPVVTATSAGISAVDLFAGCGGMTLGLEEAARQEGCHLKVALAVDSDADALGIYKANVPTARTQVSSAESIFAGAVGTPATDAEARLSESIGPLDVLMGGPPCQGHSDLNNHTRRDDPKNGLYLLMARAAAVLLPRVVVIENVATVRLDKAGVMRATSEALASSGYTVAGDVLDLGRLGVPQRRRRFVLIASRLATISPAQLLITLRNAMPDHEYRTVGWAIRDLLGASSDSTYDSSSRASKKNVKRIARLFDTKLYDLPNKYRPECHRDGEHSYVSMYGRLKWGEPAQTITTGFGSMGQGRYVHPQRRRTLTPHEAARLQTFPDWFDFGADTSRGVLAKVIGNAVPPLLMLSVGRILIPALRAARGAQVRETQVRKREKETASVLA